MALGRTFTGLPGKASVSTGGPLEISVDIDAVMNAVNNVGTELGIVINPDGTIDPVGKDYYTKAEINSTTSGTSGADLSGYSGLIPSGLATTVRQALDYLYDQSGLVLPPDNSITNIKLGPDVKVGSLALLETIIKTDVVSAINEVNSNLAGDATYETHTQDVSIQSLPTSALRGTMHEWEHNGRTLVNGIPNGDSGSIASSGTGEYFAYKNDGTLVANDGVTYNGASSYPIVNGHKYFAYVKTTDAIQCGIIRFIYSDNSFETINVLDDPTDESYGIITLTTTDVASFVVRASSSVSGTFEKQSTALIDMTALGIESYTEEQMLDLVRQGYIDGLQSVKNPSIEGVGKNKFDKTKNIIGSFYDASGNFVFDSRYLTNTIQIVKEGDNYTVSDAIGNFKWFIQGFDNNGAFTGTLVATVSGVQSFTIPNGTAQIVIQGRNIDGSDMTIDYMQSLQIQLEVGTTATDYAPHESNILSTVDVELGSVPNGTKDRMYEANGEVFKEESVNAYTLQASDVDSLNTANTNIDIVLLDASVGMDGSKINWDNAAIAQNDVKWNTFDNGIFADSPASYYVVYSSSGSLKLQVPKGEYATLTDAQNDLAGTKIVYQLETPSTINLTEQGKVHGQVESFEDGTMILESETFNGSFEGEVPTNIGAQNETRSKGVNSNSKQANIDDFIYKIYTATGTASDVIVTTDNGNFPYDDGRWVQFEVVETGNISSLSVDGGEVVTAQARDGNTLPVSVGDIITAKYDGSGNTPFFLLAPKGGATQINGAVVKQVKLSDAVSARDQVAYDYNTGTYYATTEATLDDHKMVRISETKYVVAYKKQSTIRYYFKVIEYNPSTGAIIVGAEYDFGTFERIAIDRYGSDKVILAYSNGTSVISGAVITVTGFTMSIGSVTALYTHSAEALVDDIRLTDTNRCVVGIFTVNSSRYDPRLLGCTLTTTINYVASSVTFFDGNTSLNSSRCRLELRQTDEVYVMQTEPGGSKYVGCYTWNGTLFSQSVSEISVGSTATGIKRIDDTYVSVFNQLSSGASVISNASSMTVLGVFGSSMTWYGTNPLKATNAIDTWATGDGKIHMVQTFKDFYPLTSEWPYYTVFGINNNNAYDQKGIENLAGEGEKLTLPENSDIFTTEHVLYAQRDAAFRVGVNGLQFVPDKVRAIDTAVTRKITRPIGYATQDGSVNDTINIVAWS